MGHLTVLEGNGDTRQAATSHLQAELLSLCEQEIAPLAHRYGVTAAVHTPSMTWKPLVLLLGDHSAGKSSFINNLLGFPLQPEGQEKSQHDFTVITGFRADESNEAGSGGASIEEKRGDSLISDELYPFAGLSRFGASFASHFTLKKVQLPRLANIALIDTPPLVRGEGSYGDDGAEVRGEALAALAALADMIVVFFDPHRPWNFPETYQRLKEVMPEEILERKCSFVLNRIDTCTHLSDFLGVYAGLYWRLAKTLQKAEIPKVFLTYSKAHCRQDALAKKPFVAEIGSDQAGVEQAIFSAAALRLQHIAEYVGEQSRNLQLMVQMHMAFHKKNSRYLLKWGSAACVLSSGCASAGWYYAGAALGDASPRNPLVSTGIAAASGLLFFLLLMLVINKVGKKYARKSWLENLDDEVPQGSSGERAIWQAVRAPLQAYLSRFGQQKSSMKKMKKDLRQMERLQQMLSEELNPAIKELL